MTVVRQKRRRYTLPHMALDKLPEPPRVHAMDKPGDAWRVHMAGVGGMGIGVVSAILVRAGHKEGYRVIFADKKGLAIRNGGVYSQITFVKDAGANRTASQYAYPTTGSIPYGKADLLLGIDILEAARAIDPREQFRVASTDRTAAVLNLHKQPTVYTLLGKEDFDPEAAPRGNLRALPRRACFAKNLSELCEQRLGSKQFANIMMLGVAYQLGLIPVSAHAASPGRSRIRSAAITARISRRSTSAASWRWSRARCRSKPEPETWEQLVTNKIRILRKTQLLRPQRWRCSSSSWCRAR